jgi:pilus assembly protein CpaF
MFRLKIHKTGGSANEASHEASIEERSFPMDRVSIGRVAANDLVLSDISVSKHHAELRRSGDRLWVHDLNSTNGCLLGRRPIPSGEEMIWPPGEVLRIGAFTLALENGDQPPVEKHPPRPAGERRRAVEGRRQAPAARHKTPEVIRLRNLVHRRLLEMIDLRRLDLKEVDDQKLREQCHEIIQRIMNDYRHQIPDGLPEAEFVKDVLDEALGLGPLEDLIADADVSEIMVNRKDQIFVERRGRLELSPKIFSSDLSLMGVITRIVGPIGRRVDESSPMVDARLKDGSRVNVIIPPLALNGPSVTIRKFPTSPLRVKDLIGFETLTPSMAAFIQTCVVHRKNIVISGGTGSGKTTTLNILSGYIPEDERIVTIEDAAELQLPQEHVVRMESRPPNIEGKGAVSIRDLVRNALRMRPDRIIVGECRGGEALDMLQAMNTGHDGSLTTGHANSPEDMLSRLETMVMMSGEDLPSRAIREQIASGIDFIIQQTRFSCGTRKITHIAEVAGIEEGRVVLQDIFYFKQEGFDSEGFTRGRFMATGWIPGFYDELQQRGIEMDMTIFHN